MLNVSFVLELYSKYGPSTRDVLFNEDFSLRDPMLGPKMASKSMFEMLSSRATLDLKILPNLGCMYEYEVLNCSTYY